MQSVNNFFIEKADDRMPYQINPELKLHFNNDQEAAKYLVELLRFWAPKIRMFCSAKPEDYRTIHEDKWRFSVGRVDGCEYSNFGREIVIKIFSNSSEWDHEWEYTDPPIFDSCDLSSKEGWSIHFLALKYFSKNGKEKTSNLVREATTFYDYFSVTDGEKLSELIRSEIDGQKNL